MRNNITVQAQVPRKGGSVGLDVEEDAEGRWIWLLEPGVQERGFWVRDSGDSPVRQQRLACPAV